jgi:predicted nucleic-acid-binding Zn-ribbon protein
MSWTPERAFYLMMTYTNLGDPVVVSDLTVNFISMRNTNVVYKARVQPSTFSADSIEIFSNGLTMDDYKIEVTHATRGLFTCTHMFKAETNITSFSSDEGSVNGYQELTITGTNFGNSTLDIKVKFGDQQINPISVSETTIVIRTPAIYLNQGTTELMVDFEVFYKEYVTIPCMDCKYTYSEAKTPVITNVTLTDSLITIEGTNFNGAAAELWIDDQEQTGALTVTSTSVSGTITSVRSISGMAMVTLITEDGSAIYQMEYDIPMNFTAISMTHGSLAGNILELIVEGMSMNDQVALYTSESMMISHRVISQSWSKIILETVVFNSSSTYTGLILSVNEMNFTCAACAIEISSTVTPHLTSFTQSGMVVDLTGTTFGASGDHAIV